MKFKLTALLFLALMLLNPLTAEDSDMFPPAPNFRLRGVTGNRLELKEDLAGRPVIIIFWASWCEPGIQEIRELAKVDDRLPEDTAVVTIALGDNWRTLRPYYRDKDNPFPYEIYYGGKWMANMYKIWGMPTIYILDREHRIREKYSGYINVKKLISAVRKFD
jgi:thiol-disulfide isomerase/thioredoxin